MPKRWMIAQAPDISTHKLSIPTPKPDWDCGRRYGGMFKLREAGMETDGGLAEWLKH